MMLNKMLLVHRPVLAAQCRAHLLKILPARHVIKTSPQTTNFLLNKLPLIRFCDNNSNKTT